SDREHAVLGFGTDWGSIASAWLAEWERTGDPALGERLRNSMRTIGAQPRGFFSAQSRMNLDTGVVDVKTDDRVSVSHLSAVFGLVEVCAELVQLIDEPRFRAAWLDYCRLYNAPAEEQERQLGRALQGLNLQQGHSRLTAFAAKELGQPELAARAWREFRGGGGGITRRELTATRRVTGPDVLNSFDEAPWVSTNGVAQWGLAAIQCLALAGDAVPE
ncbi:MAG TPA: Tat pathway signal sequence domain protein, partial [Candidatus Synoicihabitans sp.]|nr:Tat pathway signal sequence domain protein [Candidatus Synoicihabitans sp.]